MPVGSDPFGELVSAPNDPFGELVTPPPQAEPSFGRPDPIQYRNDLLRSAKSALGGFMGGIPFLDQLIASQGLGEGGTAPIGPDEQYAANLQRLQQFTKKGYAEDPIGAATGAISAALIPIPGLSTAGKAISGTARALGLGEFATRALEAVGLGAGVGALQGASQAPDLSQLGDVAQRAGQGALMGGVTGAALGVPLGAMAGRAAGRISRSAEAQGLLDAENAAAQMQQAREAAPGYMKDVKAGVKAQAIAAQEAADLATKQKIAAAVEAARAPKPENYLNYAGLENAAGTRAFGTRLPGEAFTEMNQIWHEPLPGMPSRTWGDIAQLAPKEKQVAATAIKDSVGKQLGELRDELQIASGGATINGQELLKNFRDIGGTNPTEGTKAALEELERIVREAAPSGGPLAKKLVTPQGQPVADLGPIPLDPKAIYSVQKSIEESLGAGNIPAALKNADVRLIVDARKVVVNALQQEFEKYLPERAAEAAQARGQYRHARIMEQGAISQAQRVQGKAEYGTGVRNLPTAQEVAKTIEPVAPEFTGKGAPYPNPPKSVPLTQSEEEQLAAERSRLRNASSMNTMPNELMKMGGGLVGSGLAHVMGGGGISGGLSYFAGKAAVTPIANAFFPKVNPTIGEIAALSPAAQRTMERLGPMLKVAAQSGPRVVKAIHEAFLAADPSYKALYQEVSQP